MTDKYTNAIRQIELLIGDFNMNADMQVVQALKDTQILLTNTMLNVLRTNGECIRPLTYDERKMLLDGVQANSPYNNNKIPVIRMVRQRTSLGLKEAKDLVEGEIERINKINQEKSYASN